MRVTSNEMVEISSSLGTPGAPPLVIIGLLGLWTLCLFSSFGCVVGVAPLDLWARPMIVSREGEEWGRSESDREVERCECGSDTEVGGSEKQ